ncbi:MAG: L,D-transpeptidase [Verrucomicrobia bacterium]|nr:L,D-transpeptidase [Verrucomicrobiota bacterium]
MHHALPILRIAAAASALLLASCATKTTPPPTTDASGKFVNPYPPGTYEHFTAEPTYPKTYSIWKNEELLAKTNPENSSLRILTGKQRGLLMNGEDIVMDYPICSGRNGYETPKGEYRISEKVVDKRSNRYGRIYDSEGDCVNSDADILKDQVPEGGRFEGAAMRYWMRLTNDGIGHHIGPVKRYRASHGCIRGPGSAVPIVHNKVKLGTKVVVE